MKKPSRMRCAHTCGNRLTCRMNACRSDTSARQAQISIKSRYEAAPVERTGSLHINATTTSGNCSREPKVRNCMPAQDTQQIHALKHLPIGIEATGERKETDSMGEIEVPANHYW